MSVNYEDIITELKEINTKLEAQQQLALSVPQAAELIGISHTKLGEMCRRNEVPHVKLGRRTVIPRKQLERWLERRAKNEVS